MLVGRETSSGGSTRAEWHRTTVRRPDPHVSRFRWCSVHPDMRGCRSYAARGLARSRCCRISTGAQVASSEMFGATTADPPTHDSRRPTTLVPALHQHSRSMVRRVQPARSRRPEPSNMRHASGEAAHCRTGLCSARLGGRTAARAMRSWTWLCGGNIEHFDHDGGATCYGHFVLAERRQGPGGT